MTTNDDALVEKLFDTLEHTPWSNKDVFNAALAIVRPIIEREAERKALEKAAKHVLNTRDGYEWRHPIKASQQIACSIRALIPRDEEETK